MFVLYFPKGKSFDCLYNNGRYGITYLLIDFEYIFIHNSILNMVL